MAPIDHIVLYILFFIALYQFCCKSDRAKNSNQFWKFAIPTILLFVLIEGCRYGRGVDYLSYKYRYEHIDIFEPQKLYLGINQFLHFIGANYVGAFMFYSLIFIVGAFYFIRNTFNKQEAKWMYLGAIISMLMKFESFPKQYLGLPFILWAIPFMFERKTWIVTVLFVLLGVNIHSGLTFLVLALIGSYYFLRRTLPIKYWLLLLFIAYYILPPGLLAGFFTSILQALNLDSLLASNHVTTYIDNADRWLGEDSFIEATQQTLLTKSMQFLFESSVLISSSLALLVKPNRKILFLFNITAVGFVFYRMFFGFEIFARLFGQLSIFWFVPMGYAIYVLTNINWTPKQRLIMKSCICYAILYQVLYFARFIFLNPEATYVWNL